MPRRSPKGAQTVKLGVCLSPETKKRLVDDSYERFGKRKGAISMNLESILRIHYGMHIPGVKEI